MWNRKKMFVKITGKKIEKKSVDKKSLKRATPQWKKGVGDQGLASEIEADCHQAGLTLRQQKKVGGGWGGGGGGGADRSGIKGRIPTQNESSGFQH